MTFFPNLRFPGFENEWEVKKLGDVIKFKAGYAFKSVNMLSEKSNYQLLKMSNIYQNELRLDRNASYWENINDKIKEFLLQKGDSVLTLTGTVGKKDFGYSVMIDDDDKYLLNQRLVLLREKKGKSINGYINQILLSERFLFYFFAEAKGGTGNQTNVGIDDIKNIQLYFPIILEQQKVSSFFALIDTRIQTQKKIIEKLETLMKVSRINIFSQKLRFKDEQGYDFPDWKKLKLGKIGNFQTSSIDKLSKENENEVYLVNYMNVYRHEDINSSTIKSFQKVTAKEQQITSCNLKKGDILFTPSSETPDDIGHSVVISENLENAVFSYHLMRFRPKIEIDILYSHHFCNVPIVLNQLSKFATGSTRFTISVKSFSDVEISLPSLPEQKVIGRLLSLVENKIDTEKQILEKLELQKKFLLGNLFV